MNNLKKELDDLDAAITQTIANGAALMADISRLRIVNAELLNALDGAHQALRVALPFCPPDKEAHFCGEWLSEIGAALSRARGRA